MKVDFHLLSSLKAWAEETSHNQIILKLMSSQKCLLDEAIALKLLSKSLFSAKAASEWVPGVINMALNNPYFCPKKHIFLIEPYINSK